MRRCDSVATLSPAGQSCTIEASPPSHLASQHADGGAVHEDEEHDPTPPLRERSVPLTAPDEALQTARKDRHLSSWAAQEWCEQPLQKQ